MPYEEVITLDIKGCSLTAETLSTDSSTDNTEGEAASMSDSAEQTSTESSSASVENNDSIDSRESEIIDNSLSDRVKNKSLLKIFILSFLSGFAALLTPCVFPMIPMTVSFFTKTSKTKSQGIKNAVIYGISIIVIYILLGTLVTAIFGAETLNNMSTDPIFNIVFFVLLVVFAVSFMGAFEIRMPSSWVNKADQRADKGGLIGIFFMALALALVSFSCTGPIVGSLLVQAASEGGIAPFVGMFGFSLALALPFALFAMFPGWLNTLPQSGGWLNSVKVVLGILELALAFKFLSNADLSLQTHFLERELFLAIWIAIFAFLTMYLFGFIRMPHDSPLEKLSVGRSMLGLSVFVFVIYMIPGLWGAPLKLISAFPPPMSYSESPLGFGGAGQYQVLDNMEDGMHLGPQNIMVFHEFDKAEAYAKKVGKPLLIDFTGHNCVNCRKMEQSVWGEPGVIDMLKNDVVIVSLHVDERIALPESERVKVMMPNGKERTLKTTGDKWMYMQISRYKVAAQPYYRMIDNKGNDLINGSADYEKHRDVENFKEWLTQGINDFNKNK
jgi:thiol:disulfide interchange protein DsbD